MDRWKPSENLVFLTLKWNKFHGNIPPQLCHLPYIQILDLSSNNSEIIPKCFDNFTATIQTISSNSSIISTYYSIVGNDKSFCETYLLWKCSFNVEKRSIGVQKCLGLVKSLDLWSNQLSGAVLEELMEYCQAEKQAQEINGITSSCVKSSCKLM